VRNARRRFHGRRDPASTRTMSIVCRRFIWSCHRRPKYWVDGLAVLSSAPYLSRLRFSTLNQCSANFIHRSAAARPGNDCGMSVGRNREATRVRWS
jgi:hypothetical protein